MYYSQELLVPICVALALYIRSWDVGAALARLSRLHRAKDASEEEDEEEEAPHNLHHTIPRPNGEAGWGGDSGRGFNIQNLIGLSEDKAQYNAITVSLCPSMIHFPDLILGSCLECYACSLQSQRSNSLAFTRPRYISDNACYRSGLSIMLLMN